MTIGLACSADGTRNIIDGVQTLRANFLNAAVRGIDNRTSIRQNSLFNSATISQAGSRHTTLIRQEGGDANLASISQASPPIKNVSYETTYVTTYETTYVTTYVTTYEPRGGVAVNCTRQRPLLSSKPRLAR